MDTAFLEKLNFRTHYLEKAKHLLAIKKPVEAQKALRQADAGRYLEKVSSLFSPGPTGTNVMDLAIILKL